MYDNEQTKTESRGRDGGNVSVDGSYRYVRPESKEMLYRDAEIEPCADAARMPRYFEPAQKEPPEPEVQAPPCAPPEEQVTPKIMTRFWVKAVILTAQT